MSADPRYHEAQVGETKFVVLRRYQDLKPSSTREDARRGDRGVSCKAIDTVTGEEVTIEKLSRPYSHPSLAKKTIRELTIWSSLNQRSIVKLLDIFAPAVEKRSKDIYFVLPVAEGFMGSFLENVCKERERIKTTFVALPVIYTLCGLEHLNSAGLIHGDLKRIYTGITDVYPTGRTNWCILDFGFPRSVVAGLNLLQHTETNSYRSPEVILGMDFGPKADVWSVGCMMAEMMTGRVFFEGANQKDQWDKITEMLGTPSREFIDRLRPELIDFVDSRPVHGGTAFEELLNTVDMPHDLGQEEMNYINARDLVSKMLVIDPESRISVKDALDHIFIRKWAEMGSFDRDHPAIEKYDHSLEDKDLSRGQWRQLIFEQVRSMEQKLNLQAAKY